MRSVRRRGSVGVLRAFLALWVLLGVGVVATAYGAFAESAAAPLSALWALPALAGWTGLSLALRGRGRAERAFWPAVATVTAAYLAVSLWFMRAYRYEPLWDPAALFYGAQGWAKGDLSLYPRPTYDPSTYFYYFPNNLGATAFLALWLRLTGGLVQDAYLAACALNALLMAAALLSTALAAREIGGPRAGLCALAVLACTPPLWLSCGAFYTDFLSICFPVAGLYCALRAGRAQQGRPARAALLGAAACLWAVGAMVKITVLIAPIAFVLWQAARGEWKRAGALALAAALAFGGAQLALDRAVYPAQLDRKTARRMNTPLTHWVMMGLRGDGFYNGEDYDFTRSFADPAERRAAVGAAIRERLRERGLPGLAELALRKAGYTLSDGTLMLSDYYDDHPSSSPALQDLLLPGGTRYTIWKAASGGVHLAMLLLALAGAAREALRRRPGAGGCVFLAIFGLLLFLAFWETSRRYWLNFLPLFALAAARGLSRQEEEKTSGARGKRVL